jgi:ABC-2 type transport system permease protein
MTTTDIRPSTADRSTAGRDLTFWRIVRSEWIKLRSLRSTFWSYAIVIVMSVGMAALSSLNSGFNNSGPMPAAQQAHVVAQSTMFGIYFGQLVVAVLGVLVISGEYSTGMIRSTLAAVPQRLPALWAKAVVLFTATLVVGLVSTFGAILVAMPILAGKGITAGLTEPDVFLPPLYGALYLALLSVFALGIGAMLRNSAGGIAAVLGILLLLSTLWSLIPGDWARDAMQYLFSNAGANFFTAGGMGGGMGDGQLEVWQSLLVVLAWIAASLVGAALLLKRRDA